MKFGMTCFVLGAIMSLTGHNGAALAFLALSGICYKYRTRVL